MCRLPRRLLLLLRLCRPPPAPLSPAVQRVRASLQRPRPPAAARRSAARCCRAAEPQRPASPRPPSRPARTTCTLTVRPTPLMYSSAPSEAHLSSVRVVCESCARCAEERLARLPCGTAARRMTSSQTQASEVCSRGCAQAPRAAPRCAPKKPSVGLRARRPARCRRRTAVLPQALSVNLRARPTWERCHGSDGPRPRACCSVHSNHQLLT